MSISGFLTAGSAARSAPSAVDAILDAVRVHLGMEIAFASRYADGRREFTHVRSSIPLPVGPGDSDPVENSFCHHILEGRLPELIHNAADIPFARTIPITDVLPVGAHLDVPLRLKDGSVYGSFCCLHRQADYSLTERDLSTLRAFAELAAVQIEADMETSRSRERNLSRFNEAMAQGYPAVVFQPIHRLADGEIIGVEALSRFPDQTERPPCLWFNEAAELGLGQELEVAAVRSALLGLPYLSEPIYLAVNVSPATVLSGALEPILSQAPPGRMVVELTEHEEVGDYDALRTALERLRPFARIAIDDVGAGYSSLRHILDLSPDILKLDMSLTRDVDKDPARRALIGAMVNFAQGVGSTIVAEGVERDGEREALMALGIAAGQGWLFSRAMPMVAVQQMLLAGGPARPRVERRGWRARRA